MVCSDIKQEINTCFVTASMHLGSSLRLLRPPPKGSACFGYPRGGAVTAAVLADGIGAEMDVVSLRKLRVRTRRRAGHRRHF